MAHFVAHSGNDMAHPNTNAGKNKLARAEKTHISFRPSGPIRSIIHNEMRKDKNRSRVIERLIAAGAGDKYARLVERFAILQVEDSK